MQALRDAVTRIQEVVRTIEALEAKVALPIQECSIPEAFTRLRTGLGADALISIYPPSLDWYSLEQKVVAGKWRVYDGARIHEAGTLAMAVNMALGREVRDTPEVIEEELGQLVEVTY